MFGAGSTPNVFLERAKKYSDRPLSGHCGHVVHAADQFFISECGSSSPLLRPPKLAQGEGHRSWCLCQGFHVKRQARCVIRYQGTLNVETRRHV